MAAMKTIDGKTLLATSLPLLFSALAAADGDGLISNMEMVETLQKEMKLRRQKQTGR